MNCAIYLEAEGVYLSLRTDDHPEVLDSELRTHFHIVEGRLRFANAPEQATLLLSTDNADVMTFSVTRTDDAKIQDSPSVFDALCLVCERVAARLTERLDPLGVAVSDIEIVFIGCEHPLLTDAAVRSGFGKITWIHLTDAAIREWQWTASDEARSARDVIVLRCDEHALQWDFRVASPHGDFVIIPDTELRSYGGFRLTGTTPRLNIGLKRFLDWMEHIDGSQHVVFTGNHSEKLADLKGTLEMQGQDVFVCNTVLGGARPAFPSKFATFDTAVSVALLAVEKALETQTRAAFNVAIKSFTEAEAVFDEEAPDELNELRRRIRDALLVAADRTQKEKEDGYFLFQHALHLSTGDDAETAEVHARRAAYCIKIADHMQAEEAAVSAYFFDSMTYPDIIDETAAEILQKRRYP